VSTRYPTSDDEERAAAIEAASLAVRRGQLIVLPTDTVYGVGADAFDPEAVTALLKAKGRGRDMPPPVLVSSATTADALAVGLPAYARALIDAFWPGPLTIVARQQKSLQWDLGDTRGTVAIRMPDHPVALEILERTGPLAVSSANTTGQPAATNADQAELMLADAVEVVDRRPAVEGSAHAVEHAPQQFGADGHAGRSDVEARRGSDLESAHLAQGHADRAAFAEGDDLSQDPLVAAATITEADHVTDGGGEPLDLERQPDDADHASRHLGEAGGERAADQRVGEQRAHRSTPVECWSSISMASSGHSTTGLPTPSG